MICPDEVKCFCTHAYVLNRFTSRITELMKVLRELNAGKYERTMVSQQEKGTRHSDHNDICDPNERQSVEHNFLYISFPIESDTAEKLVLVPGSGLIINRDNLIK